MGISQKAAKIAVFNSSLTRFVLPLGILVIPPSLWFLVERIKSPKNAIIIGIIDLIIISFQLTVSLPISLSLFSQEMYVNAIDLE